MGLPQTQSRERTVKRRHDRRGETEKESEEERGTEMIDVACSGLVMTGMQ